MTKNEVIKQLEDLLGDRRSFFQGDSDDEFFCADADALMFAISALKGEKVCTELKPCPFCGSNDIDILRCESDCHSGRVICDQCDAVIPVIYTDKSLSFEQTAARQWNMRNGVKWEMTNDEVIKQLDGLLGDRISFFENGNDIFRIDADALMFAISALKGEGN